MLKTDIYSEEILDSERSFRYIQIVTKNVIGILSRISSLMRRKRYNMEEVSISFDNANRAYIVVAIDGRQHDVHHVIEQLRKLYDVYDVFDVTHRAENLYFLIGASVHEEEEFKKFPRQPERIIATPDAKIGFFTLSLKDLPHFSQYLFQNRIPFTRRIIGLIV